MFCRLRYHDSYDKIFKTRAIKISNQTSEEIHQMIPQRIIWSEAPARSPLAKENVAVSMTQIESEVLSVSSS